MAARLLIVEDEMIVQMHLKSIALKLGHRVVGVAATAETALERADQEPPDLVLMDVQLARGGDGVATAARLRERHDCAVVFITGNSDSETIGRAGDVAAGGYIIKPFTAAEVQAAITTALASHQRLRRAEERERRLGSALDALGEALLVVSSDGSIQFASPAATALLGVRTQEADGARLRDLLRPLSARDEEELDTSLRKAWRETSSPTTLSVSMRGQDAPERLLDIRVEPVQDTEIGAPCALLTLSSSAAASEAAMGRCVPVEPRDDGRLRLLVYSHDTLGLGHLRRSLNLIRALSQELPDLSTLLVTGSPVAHRYDLPPGADYLKLPAVRKIAPDAYEPRSLSMSDTGIHSLRSSLLLRTVRDYAPHVVLVDHSPRGMNGELLPALEWLRSQKSCTTILGLRDVIDEPERVVSAWERDGVYDLLNNAYDRIVVYGSPEFYDTARVYRFSEEMTRKTLYLHHVTGAPTEPDPQPRASRQGSKLIAVTIGGGDGGDDTLIGPFLEMFRERHVRLDATAEIVLGPFVPPKSRARLLELAQGLPVVLHDFLPDPTELLRRSDLVVATAGYNTTVELLAHARRAIQVPRVVHRHEQLIRARRMAELGLTTWIHPNDVHPERLGCEVERQLCDETEPLTDARAAGRFPLDGAVRLARLVQEVAAASGRSRLSATSAE